jgi:hypothetical protein
MEIPLKYLTIKTKPAEFEKQTFCTKTFPDSDRQGACRPNVSFISVSTVRCELGLSHVY